MGPAVIIVGTPDARPPTVPRAPVALRPMVRADLPAVRRIDAESYPEPWSRRLWQRELERDDRIYLVAVDGDENGHVVGFSGAMLVVEDAHLMTIATAVAHRRRGVAALLLHRTIERAIAMGASALTLEVRMSNTEAQSLYRRFGLAPAGVRRGYYSPEGEDALVMWVHDIDGDAYRARLRSIRPLESDR